jgi:choline monooxygenase
MSRYFVDPDIAKAKTTDADFYTSVEVFEECKEKLFATSWQFIGSEDILLLYWEIILTNLYY